MTTLGILPNSPRQLEQAPVLVQSAADGPITSVAYKALELIGSLFSGLATLVLTPYHFVIHLTGFSGNKVPAPSQPQLSDSADPFSSSPIQALLNNRKTLITAATVGLGLAVATLATYYLFPASPPVVAPLPALEIRNVKALNSLLYDSIAVVAFVAGGILCCTNWNKTAADNNSAKETSLLQALQQEEIEDITANAVPLISSLGSNGPKSNSPDDRAVREEPVAKGYQEVVERAKFGNKNYLEAAQAKARADQKGDEKQVMPRRKRRRNPVIPSCKALVAGWGGSVRVIARRGSAAERKLSVFAATYPDSIKFNRNTGDDTLNYQICLSQLKGNKKLFNELLALQQVTENFDQNSDASRRSLQELFERNFLDAEVQIIPDDAETEFSDDE